MAVAGEWLALPGSGSAALLAGGKLLLPISDGGL